MVAAGIMAAIMAVSLLIWWLDEIGLIYRKQFDWPSFATLATGAGALAGAVWVGLKQVEITQAQVGIAKRQEMIMERQTDIQYLTLKSEMFDRRIAAYSDIRNHAMFIYRPGLEGHEEVLNNALRGLQSCNFVFNADVNMAAFHIFMQVEKYLTRKRTLIENNRLNISTVDPDDDAIQKVEKGKIEAKLVDFDKAVSPYMKLDEHAPPI